MENNPYVITKFDPSYDPGGKIDGQGKLARANIRIFLGDKMTSRPGMSNIMEDFAWRRSGNTEQIHEKFCSDKNLKETIINKLKEIKMFPEKCNDIKLEFDRYTGCSMCPCSPGIIVKIPGVPKRRTTPALWINLKLNKGEDQNES